MAVTPKEFVRGLVESGLMTAAEVRALRDTVPASKRVSVEALARELVQIGRLTGYQVARIAEGKAKGLVLGKNVILEKIGEGGMGQVFRAEHRRMKRPVVVKVLPESATQSEYSIQRFQREVEAAAQLAHPNIVTAFDADEENGVYFLVMEYVDGVDLATLVARDGPLPLAKAIDCILQAARGLEYAHARGIVHRDIKPDNLLLDKNGVVKILDMGLARFDTTLSAGELTRDLNLTAAHQILGTVDYMSPEQAEDSSHVDARSDIYSLGCTMYRLLTGMPPYHRNSIVEKLVAHRVDPIPSLEAVLKGAPERLNNIFQRMVAKAPKDRYQSMSNVIRDLEEYVAQHFNEADYAAAGDAAQVPAYITGNAASRILDKRDLERLKHSSAEHQRSSFTVDLRAQQRTIDTQADLDTKPGPTPSVQPRKSTEPAIGIDLGTTFSAIAYLDDLGRPQTLLNIEGDKTTPSVVLFDGLDVVVGKEAVKAMATDMDMIAECAKRDVGCNTFHKLFGKHRFPPEALEAWVLNKLRIDAQRQIGAFQKVVVTVPAYFDETRRKATQDAGYIAGFEVIDIINEPTAAAIAYGFQQGFLRPGGGGQWQTILVYDLGGGTFDVTIMETDGREFIALATDGDVRLGGRDWDDRLVDYVADQFFDEHELDPRSEANSLGKLWRACEDAKRTLSARQKTAIHCDFEGKSSLVEITRQKFEELTADLLARTEFTTRQAVQAANLEWKDIDRVLLVGGSTRMPAVVDMLRSLSGKEPDCSVSPDEAVAHGAALHAGLVLDRREGISARFTVTNVSSHSLGVVGTNLKTRRRQTAVLIPRNTALPVVAEKTFYTHKIGQQSVLVRIVEGESENPSDCSQVGECVVRDLPPNLPVQTPIRVRFRYKENGRLTVTVKVHGTDKFIEQDISRENSLTSEALDEWRKKVSGLPPAKQPSMQDSLILDRRTLAQKRQRN